MDLKELQERNYAATVRRGLISEKTQITEFLKKIEEEFNELDFSVYLWEGESFDEKELADIILVCLAMAKHYDIDIIKVLEEKVIINENRKD